MTWVMSSLNESSAGIGAAGLMYRTWVLLFLILVQPKTETTPVMDAFDWF